MVRDLCSFAVREESARATDKKKVESFLPLVEEVRLWSDRKKKVREPLFRGYVFVRIDLKERLRVLQTVGVVKFVGTGQRASVVPDKQIEWVRAVVDSNVPVERESYPNAGQEVEVIGGPLIGLRGTVSSVKSRTRVVVGIETISQAFSIEIRPNFLKAV